MRQTIKNIKISGHGPSNYKFEYFKPQFTKLIGEVRKTFKIGGHEKMEWAGYRFLNDDAVWSRISFGLTCANFEPNFDDIITNSISDDEMKMLIEKALKDCASADYWYKFEKSYD